MSTAVHEKYNTKQTEDNKVKKSKKLTVEQSNVCDEKW